MGVEWGTWEELILGGAVLRHGTKDWNVVSQELRLRARSLFPFKFTPQVCKSKYEDLQKRYSGSKAWFDELKKRRVAELKQELARSADSIGSLESKIKTLEAQHEICIQAKVASQSESPLPPLNSNSSESFSKNTSKNEHSAASFTEDTRVSNSWCERHNQENELEKNTGSMGSSEQKNDSNVNEVPEAGYGKAVTIRKRRGQRKRKNCNLAVAEVSVGESENLGSSNVASVSKGRSANDCITRIMDRSTNNNNGTLRVIRRDDNLMDIFESVAETDPAGVFKHRMDSQKRARYRKIIRQHLDMGTIRSRIFSRVIRSPKELFRDLLLLANNALVFYSKRTREYKSAFSLRQLVMKEYKQYCRGSTHEVTSAFIPCNPPVKPRSARPRPRPHLIPFKDRLPEKETIPCKDKLLEKETISHTNKVPEKEAIPCKDKVPKKEAISCKDNVPEKEAISWKDKVLKKEAISWKEKVLEKEAIPCKEKVLKKEAISWKEKVLEKEAIPCKDKVPEKEEKLSVTENVLSPLEEVKKPLDSDDHVSLFSLGKAKKGLKRPAKVKPPVKAKPDVVEKRSRNSPVKPRKRVRK